jgi:hypothetical protein
MSISHITDRRKTAEKSRKDPSLIENLSLEQVCPEWSKKIGRGLDERDRIVMCSDSKYCLVGEAWGFTGRQAGYYIAPLIPLVGCWTCVKLGIKMGKICRSQDLKTTELEDTISVFLKHWNQHHKSITQKINKGKRFYQSRRYKTPLIHEKDNATL